MSQNSNVFTTRRHYGMAFFTVLLIEIAIALFVRDSFVRPFVGDTLATILVYVGIRAFSCLRFGDALLTALLISYTVEVLQYAHFLEWAGWYENAFLRIVLGSAFSWGDILAYTLGAVLILVFERIYAYEAA
ncbi:DUF2809 domain-containing protein [Marinilongibacter aquaticus]|uniref:ribosomal maturation YjgA family protein n=1 Tax=Marinilongibacter aquaticus TaxID=2975157 RepID=UPI0021BDABD5|nr:DUF2809 domain-containing protein [Marinilongibacter aquaticus]UBM58021.1 DUF2809 domain-containing protein [Marinilongibacter aquaticus]